VDTHFDPATRKLLIEVSSFQYVKKLSPNFESLTKINFGEHNVRGIAVTTIGRNEKDAAEYPLTQNYDFLSRYFAPWYEKKIFLGGFNNSNSFLERFVNYDNV
jgi:hypothetical protein